MFEVDSQLMVSAHCSNNFSVDPKFLHPIKRDNERRRRRAYALQLRNAAKPHSTA